MALQTINQLFYRAVEHRLERALLYKPAAEWIPISSDELYLRAVNVAKALAGWGITKGDRVAVLGENRPEWIIADLATMLIGAVVVPIYPTLTASQIAGLLLDSGARAMFLSSSAQLEKYRSIQAQAPLEHLILMDAIPQGAPGGTYNDANNDANNDAPNVSSNVSSMATLMASTLTARDPEFDARAQQIEAGDLATLIYTSGTTGGMKGVRLTHGNLASNIECAMTELAIHKGDRHISFLPLSHITARHVDLALLYRGATIAYCPVLDDLPVTLREIRPTIFVAVPRFYEKFKEKVEQQASGYRKTLVEWALQVGRRHISSTLEGRTPRTLSWKIADKLLFSKIRQGLGGEVRIFLAGGAPLGKALAEWFACVGLRIDEGYGLTETSPVICVNTAKAHKLGTVGKPLPNLEVRIAPDGEILVRGPSVFAGYWNRPEETLESFSDGWFKTGDIGSLDEQGFLSITDRKKNLIKTSGGKFIAPQPIEAVLKMSPLIEEAVVVGERRKFPAVVIVPAFSILEEWARQNSIAAGDRQSLVCHPRVQALYEELIATVNSNLAQFEKLKRFLLLTQSFTAADGTLTPSMKLRRKIVEERLRDRIETLYRESDATGGS